MCQPSTGDIAASGEWDARLAPLHAFCGVEPNPVPVKALLRHAGIGEGLRLPLMPLSLLNEGRLAPAAAAILALENECRRPAAASS